MFSYHKSFCHYFIFFSRFINPFIIILVLGRGSNSLDSVNETSRLAIQGFIIFNNNCFINPFIIIVVLELLFYKYSKPFDIMIPLKNC